MERTVRAKSKAGRNRKSGARRGPKVGDFPFPWRWWNSDPYVQALTLEQQGRLMRALSLSVDTQTPGMMTEEELRCRMQLSPDEWAAQRVAFEPIFGVSGTGRWIQSEFREGFLRQLERFARRSRSGRNAARKKWRDAALAASGDATDMRSHCDRIHTPTPMGLEKSNQSPSPAVSSDAEADAELDRRLEELCDRLEGHPPLPGIVLPGGPSPQDLVGEVLGNLGRRRSG